MLYEWPPDGGGRRRIYSEPVFTGDVRCDLHPRWHPDGTMLTVDAVPGGERQIYLLDVAGIVS